MFKIVLNNSIVDLNIRLNVVIGIQIGHILIVVFPMLYQTVIIKMYV